MTALSLVNPKASIVTSPRGWLKDTNVHLSRGTSKNLASVTQHTVMSMAEFVRLQIREQRTGQLSEAEYMVASKAKRDAEKGQFGWYSPSNYADKHRDQYNWLGTNSVVLDADANNGKEEGPEFSFNGDQLRARLAGLLYIALPTHSYTAEIPRWRILIVLNSVITDRAEFEKIARDLAKNLNGYVDARSFTPEQLWYDFSTPAGEWDKRKEQVIVSTTDEAAPFDVSAWRFSQKPRANSALMQALLTKPNVAHTPPETPKNIALVKGMLSSVDPDPGETGTRDRWMRLVWSFASLGWTCGEELAKEWSRAGDKWDEAEFNKVWNSYKPDGGIHFGTLRHYAKEAGWVDSTPTTPSIRDAWESLLSGR